MIAVGAKVHVIAIGAASIMPQPEGRGRRSWQRPAGCAILAYGIQRVLLQGRQDLFQGGGRLWLGGVAARFCTAAPAPAPARSQLLIQVQV